MSGWPQQRNESEPLLGPERLAGVLSVIVLIAAAFFLLGGSLPALPNFPSLAANATPTPMPTIPQVQPTDGQAIDSNARVLLLIDDELLDIRGQLQDTSPTKDIRRGMIAIRGYSPALKQLTESIGTNERLAAAAAEHERLRAALVASTDATFDYSVNNRAAYVAGARAVVLLLNELEAARAYLAGLVSGEPSPSPSPSASSSAAATAS